ncbi:unnamed protein product, partial [Heterotrigona itama]
MLLSKSFNRKQTDPLSGTLGEKNNESFPGQKSEKFARQADANVIHPLQDTKTNIPSLTLPSMHTKPNQTISHIEDRKKVSRTIEQEKKDEIKNEIKGEIKDEIKNDLDANKICSPINCTKGKYQKVDSDANETCNSAICTKNRYKEVDLDTNGICVCSEGSTETLGQHDSEDKICPTKLTEIINNSVKEAMQSIVKQCKTKEERDVDKKQTEETVFDKACYVNKEGVLAKMKCEHRPCTTHCRNSSIIEQLRKNNERNRNRLRERYNSARANFSNSKLQNKKTNAFEEMKRKRHSFNNVKTDNRRMTGNVNIYICSEASENIQAARKQDESQSCVGSSSGTTTEQSRVSSNKLLTCIRNKRRKSEGQDSFDLLPRSEESKDDSTVLSSGAYEDSRSTIKLESCNVLDICDKDVRAKDGSTSIECECKDTGNDDTPVAIGKSDLSFQKSKFVVCDKLEEPCSMAYTMKSSSNSRSGGWSSKSICSSRNTDYTWSDAWSMEPNFSCCTKDSEIRRWSLKTRENICTDRSGIWCSCKNRRSFSKTVGKESWMTCNCITEEEEDVCVDVDSCRKFEKPPVEDEEAATVCFETSEDLEGTARFVPCPQKSAEKLKEDTETSEKEEEKLPTVDLTEKDEEPKEIVHDVPKLVPPRTVKPEAIILKQLLKQSKQAKPKQIIDEKDTPPPSVKKAELLEPSTEDTAAPLKPETLQVLPRILAKYKLPKRLPSKFVEPTIGGKRTPKKVEIVEEKLVEKGLKEKALERKENDISKNTKTLVERTVEEKNHDKIEGTKMTMEEEKNTKVQEISEPLFLFKGSKKITNKTENPESILEGFEGLEERKNGIVEPSPLDIDTDKIVGVPETETNKEKLTDETKERHESKEKWIPSKLYEYMPKKISIPKKISVSIPNKIRVPMLKKIPILGGKYKSEPNAINSTRSPVNDDSDKNNKNSKVNNPTKPLVNEKNKKNNRNNPIFNPSQPMKEETINKNAKDKINRHSNEGNPDTNKSLIVTNSKDSPVSPTQNTDTELGNRENSRENRELHESLTKPQFEEELDVERDGKPELQITKTQEEKPTKMMHANVQSENELLSTQLAELESQTICTNHLGDCATTEKSTCNCCYLPTHRSNNEQSVNYPKSCLKRGRQCCHTISQESDRTIPYHDERKNWEECGCRRAIPCRNCHGPRNECRLTVNCVNCCKSRNKRKLICERRSSSGCMKSMVCLYCDNPRDKCTCRAPIQTCSYCELSVDQCMCKDQRTICDGRPVPTEPDNDRTMYVTAWRPREEVRRYFSRNLVDLKTDRIGECCYCEKLKQHNSDDLPYQRLSVFSDVMDELQQKIIESTCCARCKKIPCCCNITIENDESKEDRKIKYYISPKTRRKIIAVCMEKANNNCKYESNRAKSDKQNKIIVAVCCVCKATPCRCKRPKSSQKKLKARCYYCKNSPCTERNKSRPCRCTDSPCRGKEKERAHHAEKYPRNRRITTKGQFACTNVTPVKCYTECSVAAFCPKLKGENGFKTSEQLYYRKYSKLLELSGVGSILGFIQDAVSSALLD